MDMWTQGYISTYMQSGKAGGIVAEVNQLHFCPSN